MFDWLIHTSLKQRLLVLSLTVSVTVAGIWALLQLDVDVFPDLTAPTVTVLTECPGMDPEEIEQRVTYQLETALNGSPGVRRLRSTSTAGLSIVWVEFEWGQEIYRARQIVSEKLSTLAGQLPQGVGAPSLAPITSIMGEIMLIGLQGDSSMAKGEVRSLADWVLRPRLMALSGVAHVLVMGDAPRTVDVTTSASALQAYDLNVSDLANTLRDAYQNRGAGIVESYSNRYNVKTEGRPLDPTDLARLEIKREGRPPIRLAEIAQVTPGMLAKMGDASLNGQPAVLLVVQKQPNANTVDLTERIDQELARLESNLPPQVSLHADFFRQADFINASIGNLQRVVLEGVLVVVVVLVFFLLEWRTTLISVLAIPLSILSTLLLLKISGLTLNTMTLGGIAIAVGILVDDAVIDVENIYKRLRQNAQLPAEERQPLLQVIYEASSEVRSSILDASAIIMISFLPLFFLEGLEGRLLKPLGLSFIVSIAVSLLVALTFTPVIASYLFQGRQSWQDKRDGWLARQLQRGYAWLLKRLVLRGPLAMLVLAVGLLVVGVLSFLNLGSDFLPGFNEGSVTVSVTGKPGMSLELSNRIGTEVERRLLEVPEIEQVSRRTGRAEQDEHAAGVHASELDAPLKTSERSKAEIFEDIRQRLADVPGVTIELGQPISHRIDHMLSGSKANLAIKLFGDDPTQLYSLAIRLKNTIEHVPGLVDLTEEPLIEMPRLRIQPRREVMSRYGVSQTQLMETVEAAVGGVQVGEVFEGRRRYPLRLRVQTDTTQRLRAIRQLPLVTARGHSIPLEQVADILSDGTYFELRKEDVERRIVVSANVAGRDLSSTVEEVRQVVQRELDLPEGYRVEYGGQFESQASANRRLSVAAIGGLVVVLLILYRAFGELQLALVVLLNLPLALFGGVIAVYLGPGVLNVATLIGFISLFGLATRNGLLLISRYQTLQQQGEGVRSAVYQGSLDRLNPILMTALTAGLALLPLVLAGEQAGNEIQRPMAIVVIGGLFSATILNLLVIPAAYTLLHRSQKSPNS